MNSTKPFKIRLRSQSHAGAEPRCPHFPNCFGCPLIALPYPEQLHKKRETLTAALSRYPSLMPIEVPPVIESPRRVGYRSRVKLVVRKSRAEVVTGLYVPGTHRVIDISCCPVHPGPVNQVLAFIKRKIVDLGIAPYDERVDTGLLRYLDLRYGFTRRQMTVTLVTRQRNFREGRALARAIMGHFPFVTGVIQNINEQRGNVLWGDRFVLLAGRDSIVERIGSLELRFPAGVFSQANPLTAEKIYATVTRLAALTGKESVIDLYCGVGPIALRLAPAAKQLWGLDESESAIAAAKENARRNGISNCRFRAGGIVKAFEEIRRNLGAVDLITLNPPRKGIQPDALEIVLNWAAPRAIYVACDPLSLARDLDRLVTGGYSVSSIQPFDMFPQTEQVETVALLEMH